MRAMLFDIFGVFMFRVTFFLMRIIRNIFLTILINIFHRSIKLNDAVNDALIDTVKVIIVDNKGVSINEIIKGTGKSNATVKRYLQILKTIGLIEFKGAAKSGKYFITIKALTKMNKNK
jgi:predicted transcriptional regulator